jgi:hypothetical protein
VQSVSTGAVIATVLPPKPPIADGLDIEAVAAAPDDRTFYVEYALLTPNAIGRQICIFSFSLTGSGSVTPQAIIMGWLITNSLPGQQSWGNLAVSPDGTKLALTADSTDRLPALSPAYSDKIIVIDLLTGQRTQWQGGLYRTGKQFSIPDLSWSADGRSLIFLGQWCDPPGQTASWSGGSAPGAYRDAQVWSLSVATGGGSLTRGRLLLRQSVRFHHIRKRSAAPVAPTSPSSSCPVRWPTVTGEYSPSRTSRPPPEPCSTPTTACRCPEGGVARRRSGSPPTPPGRTCSSPMGGRRVHHRVDRPRSPAPAADHAALPAP